MSSNAYSANLTPDPWLRIVVLTSGRLLIAAGLVLILMFDLNAVFRAAGCLVWVAAGHFELANLQRGFDACTSIRIDSSGAAEIFNSDQEWMPATLQTGSVLLRNLGWLRLQSTDGQYFFELVRGNARQSNDWRRLQVIWRHIGA
ncbi:MAG: hypothetical protein GWP67_03215 [Gammaproteobacteria bacterium]|nr:hypothetical protein [Gammaproteobacteria bacterium]